MTKITFEQLSNAFDGFLIDQFGVLMSASNAYAFAINTLTKLAQKHKPIVLISNSGKRATVNRKRLMASGFDCSNFHAILTSGELAYALLSQRIGDSISPNAKIWWHGQAPEDITNISGLPFSICCRPHQADLIILAGCQNQYMTLTDYKFLLKPAADKNIPMLCTNPDLTMLAAKSTLFAPGRIAQLYQELGGTVEWIGKPHSLIFSKAAALMPNMATDKILCIGDSPLHDIIGGRNAGFTTMLVRTGIHAHLTDAELRIFCQYHNAIPDFIMTHFDFLSTVTPWPSPLH